MFGILYTENRIVGGTGAININSNNTIVQHPSSKRTKKKKKKHQWMMNGQQEMIFGISLCLVDHLILFLHIEERRRL